MAARLMSRFLCAAVLAALLAGCATTSPSSPGVTPPRPARINHLAFFKLKNPADTQELIADCDVLLATIPGITSYYAGHHLDIGRGTVDGNYDVGFYIGFETEADYEAYIEHPLHELVVDKWRPRLEWLRVHDVLDETP